MNYLADLEDVILALNDVIDPLCSRGNFIFKLRKRLLFERRRVYKQGGTPSLAYITAKRVLNESNR